MPKKKTKPKAKKTTKKKGVVKKVEEKAKEVVEKAEEVAEDLGEEVGKVTHYFSKIGVAVVELTKGLKKGEKVRIKGATTDFEQPVESMQIEHKPVEKAGKGKAIGLKVKEKVRGNEKVYKVEE